MPIGPPSTPQEPLHVFHMALALVLAAFAGGALGLVWHWLSGQDTPEDEIEAASVVAAKPAEDVPATPAPAPAPRPRPSP